MAESIQSHEISALRLCGAFYVPAGIWGLGPATFCGLTAHIEHGEMAQCRKSMKIYSNELQFIEHVAVVLETAKQASRLGSYRGI
jgi:hypothetical protein